MDGEHFMDILPCFEESPLGFEFSEISKQSPNVPEIMEVCGRFVVDAKIPSDFKCFGGLRMVRGSEVGKILDTVLKFPTIFGIL